MTNPERCLGCEGSCKPSRDGVLAGFRLPEGRTTFSVEETARYLGIGRSTAYAAARDGSLPTIRISKRILVPAARLRELLGLEAAEA